MRILCFDIGGTLIKSAIYDELAGLSNFVEHKYQLLGKDGILKVIDDCAMSCEFDGMGISTAGLVDSEKGIIMFCSDSIPDYTGTRLKDILEEKYNKPVFVANDVNSAALGESHFGAGKAYKDFVCLTYGTGVGGAIVINNELYTGNNGSAAEMGHIATHLNGEKCTCGLRGCYNHYASTTNLVNMCKKVDSNIASGRDVFAEFHNGNASIKEIIDSWIDEIIYGLVTVVHIFDPEALILGGGIMKQAYIIEGINKKLRNSVLDSYKDVVVLPAKLGNTAGLMGAAHNAIERMKIIE
jgi:predicted NBD/HSP70 family sugar kinase